MLNMMWEMMLGELVDNLRINGRGWTWLVDNEEKGEMGNNDRLTHLAWADNWFLLAATVKDAQNMLNELTRLMTERL